MKITLQVHRKFCSVQHDLFVVVLVLKITVIVIYNYKLIKISLNSNVCQ